MSVDVMSGEEVRGRCAPPDRETGPVATKETLYKVSQGLDPDKVGPANMCYWDQIRGSTHNCHTSLLRLQTTYLLAGTDNQLQPSTD